MSLSCSVFSNGMPQLLDVQDLQWAFWATSFLPHPFPLGTISLFSVSLSLFLFYKEVHVSRFLNIIYLLLVSTVVSRLYSLLRCEASSWQQPLWLQSMGSRVKAQRLWSTGLAAVRHVESPQIRGSTHVACIGRQSLIHWVSGKSCIIFFLDSTHEWCYGISLVYVT